MDTLGLIVLIAVVILPAGVVAALVLALIQRRRLRDMEARLAALENRIGDIPLPRGGEFDRRAAPDADTAPPCEPTGEGPEAPPRRERPPAGGAEPEPAAENRKRPDDTPPDRPGETVAPAPPSPAAPKVARSGRKRSFEEAIGTRWSVWIGGLALALGGIFLVRYAIEQGLLGPAARIILGGLFSLLLLLLGEATRRNEKRHRLFGFDGADIPGALTAAGTVAAFATAYAAHVLYGFIGPVTAFGLLGVISLATMVLAALHAPWLAGLGLAGAFATPALVSSGEVQALPLFSYLVCVGFAALWLARIRLWRWLAIAATAGTFAWGALYLGAVGPAEYEPVTFAFFIAVEVVLVAFFLVRDPHRGEPAGTDIPADRLALAALAGFAMLAYGALQAERYGTVSLILLAAMSSGYLALAWRFSAVMPTAAIAALLTALAYLDWPATAALGGPPESLAPQTSGMPRLHSESYASFIAVGLVYGLLFFASGLAAAWRALGSGRHVAGRWAATGSTAALALLVIAYYRVADFERSITFAAAALIFTIAAAIAFELVNGRERAEKLTVPSLAGTAYAVAAIAAFSLALTIALEKGWLTISLAATAAGIAWIYKARPVAILRPLSVLLGLVVLARMAWDPAIIGTRLGTTPFFNWLLYGYGVPALAAAYAARVYGRVRQDLPVRALEAQAILFAALLAFFEIRHFIHGGDLLMEDTGLVEQSLMTLVALAFAIGLDRMHRITASPVFSFATLLFGSVGFLIIILAHLVFLNPLFDPEPVGDGILFNDLLLAYALPALLAAILHFTTRRTRPRFYVIIAGGLSLVLAFAYVSLMVRHFFQGAFLTITRATGDPELYTYSVVWLVFGILLLLGGIGKASRALRLASAIVILTTVFKVFLIDMEGLAGVWRALSFIGLGAVLIAIGALYQRLLFASRRSDGGREGEGEGEGEGKAE